MWTYLDKELKPIDHSKIQQNKSKAPKEGDFSGKKNTPKPERMTGYGCVQKMLKNRMDPEKV